MPAPVDEEYEHNVFINCPFDAEYNSLLRPLLFAVLYLGFTPRIALDRSDSGEQRINKICDLIAVSKYSIHDLSRLQSRRKNEFYRMNMPFELGIEYGCRRFARGRLRDKKCLILEKQRFDFMKAISDLSGVDIKSHDNEPIGVVRGVRNWFVETVGLRDVASPASIWFSFGDFMSDFYDQRTEEGFSAEDLGMMPIPEFVAFIQKWLQKDTGNGSGGKAVR